MQYFYFYTFIRQILKIYTYEKTFILAFINCSIN